LPYVIPLTCILTIENKNKDFIIMLNNIKDSKELLEIFDDQCLIWWNKKGLINILINLLIHIIYRFNLKCQYKVY